MKILFYGTKNYDEQFFEKLLPEFPDIKIKFIEANIHEETASLANGYEAICALFVLVFLNLQWDYTLFF